VESNFSRARHAEQLGALLHGSPCRLAELHCRAPGEVLLERYAARARNAQRHARHDDLNRIEEFRAIFADASRHEDAVIFPDRALVLDTTPEMPMDQVLRHLDPRDTKPPSAHSGMANVRPREADMSHVKCTPLQPTFAYLRKRRTGA
jgi:hypothetical protein